MTTEEKKKGEKPTCYDCHQEVIFDKKIVGKYSGKMVPLNPKTREPHKCPEEIKKSEDDFQAKNGDTVHQSFDEAAKEINPQYKPNGGVLIANSLPPGGKIELKVGEKKIQEPVKAEYLDHTLARPSEVKIFFSSKPTEVEQEYKQFQIGKKFAWTRAQYQGVYSPTAIDGIIHTIAFYYELAP